MRKETKKEKDEMFMECIGLMRETIEKMSNKRKEKLQLEQTQQEKNTEDYNKQQKTLMLQNAKKNQTRIMEIMIRLQL